MLHSYHIFLFPFKWEVKTAKDFSKCSMDERFDLEKIKKCIPENNWEEFNFTITNSGSGNTYNEFSYFYDHARPILSLDVKNEKRPEDIYSVQYTLKLQNSPQYEFTIADSNAPIKIILEIEEITLNLYKTGIGVVSFFLGNYSIDDFNVILKINEYGRRIYPQFLDAYEKINGANHKLSNGAKMNFLADEIVLRNVFTSGDAGNETEDFGHYDSYQSLRQSPLVLPKHLKNILGAKFKTKYESSETGDVLITPVIDDRMYVMSFLLSTGKMMQLGEYNETDCTYDYQTSEEWYRYVFIDDSSASCANRLMLRSQIEESSYPRWIEKKYKQEHQGSLWGASRYSLVLVAADCWFNRELLINHFRTMYFQLVLLSITQRASALSYSDEASRIARKIKNIPILDKREIRQFSDLQQSFLVFKSIINLHEITAQEQGIELYNLIRTRMNVDKEIEYLQSLIQSLHEHVQLETENKRNIEGHRLTKIATLFLPASFIAALFGIGFISGETLLFGPHPYWNLWFAWIIIIGGGLLAYFFIITYWNRNQNK